MALIIFILMILAFYHLIMEAIILPILKMNMQYKLIGLRDELIHLKAISNNLIPEVLYEFIYNSICVTHNSIDDYSLVEFVLLARKFRGDEKVEKLVDQRIQMIRDCQDKSVLKVSKRLETYTLGIFFINFASWIIYFLPILFLLIPLLIFSILVFIISRSLRRCWYYFRNEYTRIIYSFIEVETELSYEKRHKPSAFKISHRKNFYRIH